MHEREFARLPVVRRRAPPPRRADVAGKSLDLPSQIGNRAFTRHVVEAAVQRAGGRSQGAGPLDPTIDADIRAARGGGRPLDDGLRGDMESRLGVDLSAVRVHADGQGDALSRSVQADAFTSGSDVFFRSGRYAPDTGEGRWLLAHELTHVVQQASGAVPGEPRVSHPDDSQERDAARVADTVAASPLAPAPDADAPVRRQVALGEEPEGVATTTVSRGATAREGSRAPGARSASVQRDVAPERVAPREDPLVLPRSMTRPLSDLERQVVVAVRQHRADDRRLRQVISGPEGLIPGFGRFNARLRSVFGQHRFGEERLLAAVRRLDEPPSQLGTLLTAAFIAGLAAPLSGGLLAAVGIAKWSTAAAAAARGLVGAVTAIGVGTGTRKATREPESGLRDSAFALVNESNVKRSSMLHLLVDQVVEAWEVAEAVRGASDELRTLLVDKLLVRIAASDSPIDRDSYWARLAGLAILEAPKAGEAVGGIDAYRNSIWEARGLVDAVESRRRSSPWPDLATMLVALWIESGARGRGRGTRAELLDLDRRTRSWWHRVSPATPLQRELRTFFGLESKGVNPGQYWAYATSAVGRAAPVAAEYFAQVYGSLEAGEEG
jgi:hypothetical protein